MTYKSLDAKGIPRDSLDNIHEQALTEKEKNVTNFSFCFSFGQSSRNTFQTNKAVIYSRGKAPAAACNSYLMP